MKQGALGFLDWRHGYRRLGAGLFDHRQHRGPRRCRWDRRTGGTLYRLPADDRHHIAFSYLNLWRSDAGAAYAWVGRAIHPALGFIAGWALLSLSTIFMVAAALPAGEATLNLSRRNSSTTCFGRPHRRLWFLGVARDLRHHRDRQSTGRADLARIGALILVSGLAIWNARAAPPDFSWDWFFPSAFGTFVSFCAGMLITIFYYFGWTWRPTSRKKPRTPRRRRTRRRHWRPRDRCPVPFGAGRHPDGSDIRPDPGECRESASALGHVALGAPWSAIAVLAVW